MAFNFDPNKHKIVIGDHLGTGGYGAVYKVTLENSANGETIVDSKGQPIKFVFKELNAISEQMVDNSEDDSLEENKSDIELQIYKEELNDNFAAIAHTEKVIYGETRKKKGILMRYLPGDTLAKRSEENKDLYELPEQLKRQNLKDTTTILFNLALSLHNIHSNKITKVARIHRDIKPENIMVNHIVVDEPGQFDESKNLDFWDVNIIDFGFAKSVDEIQSLISAVGTSSFLAPELISPDSKSLAAKASKKSDIYALGLSIAILLDPENSKPLYAVEASNRKLLAMKNDTDMIEGVLDEIFANLVLSQQPIIQKSLKLFLRRMLDPNPDMRPDTTELLQFFTKLNLLAKSEEKEPNIPVWSAELAVMASGLGDVVIKLEDDEKVKNILGQTFPDQTFLETDLSRQDNSESTNAQLLDLTNAFMTPENEGLSEVNLINYAKPIIIEKHKAERKAQQDEMIAILDMLSLKINNEQIAKLKDNINQDNDPVDISNFSKVTARALLLNQVQIISDILQKIITNYQSKLRHGSRQQFVSQIESLKNSIVEQDFNLEDVIKQLHQIHLDVKQAHYGNHEHKFTKSRLDREIRSGLKELMKLPSKFNLPDNEVSLENEANLNEETPEKICSELPLQTQLDITDALNKMFLSYRTDVRGQRLFDSTRKNRFENVGKLKNKFMTDHKIDISNLTVSEIKTALSDARQGVKKDHKNQASHGHFKSRLATVIQTCLEAVKKAEKEIPECESNNRQAILASMSRDM